MMTMQQEAYVYKQKREASFSVMSSFVMIGFSCLLLVLAMAKPNLITSRIPLIVTLRAQLNESYYAYLDARKADFLGEDFKGGNNSVANQRTHAPAETQLEKDLLHDYMHLLFGQWRTIDRFMQFIQLLIAIFLLLLSVLSLSNALKNKKLLSLIAVNQQRKSS